MRKQFYLLLFALLAFSVNGLRAQNTIPQIGDKFATDEGVFVISGENLIANPNFEDGFTGWKNGKGGDLSDSYFAVEEAEGPDGLNILRALSNSGSGGEQSVKTGWAVTEGKTYVFTCWAKRTASGMSSNTQYSRLYVGSSETSTTTQIATLKYQADTWVQTEVIFTAEQPYLVANFGWLNSATSFTGFYLGEVSLTTELYTANLEETIAEAQELLNTTEEGDDRGQYTTAVRTALQEAITVAQGVLASAASQLEVTTAKDTLDDAISAYKQSKNPPFKLGYKYTFTNVGSGSMMLSSGGESGNVQIIESNDGNEMIFTFELAPEEAAAKGYNMKDQEGRYLYRSGSWDTKASSTADLTAANTIFQVVDYGSFVQIKNMGSGSVLGVDKTSAGSLVYSNKNGTGNNNNWILKRYVPVSERDDQYYYEEALEIIEPKYKDIDSAAVGRKAFMISAEAYAAFGNAIAESKSMTDYAAAKALIEQALADFEANKYVAPVEGTMFEFIHSSGKTLYMYSDSVRPVITTTDETTVQKYLFEKADSAGWYYVKNVATGYYLAKDSTSAWETSWLAVPGALETMWNAYAYGDKAFCLQNYASWGCLGTDATTDSASVYCDKGNWLTNSHWNITDGSGDITFDLTTFNAAVAAATEFKATMVEGYNVGEYYASDITAFAGVISAAKNNLNAAADQEAVEALAAALLADIDVYKGKAHTVSVADKFLLNLIEECQKVLDAAVVGIEKGNYSEAAKSIFQEAVNTAKAVTADYEAAITTLTAARDAFVASVVTVDRAALKAQIATSADAANAAVVGDFAGQYPADAIAALKTAVEVAQNIYNNVESSQENINEALAALKDANTTFNAAKVVIDFSGIKETIAIAKETLAAAEAEKGEGPGTYPESAFVTLQQLIDNAQAIIGTTAMNQAAVDQQSSELEAAISTFSATRVPNDYSELMKQLEIAQAIYDEAISTGAATAADLETLSDDIQKGLEALNSTSQKDIDRAVKLLKRDIQLYGKYTGIDSADATALQTVVNDRVLTVSNIPAGATVTVYNITGALEGASDGAASFSLPLAKGVYIVKLNGAGDAAVKVVVR